MTESISEIEIHHLLNRGNDLLEAGSSDAALLVVWSALEAAMRLAAGLQSKEAALLSPAILTSYLFSRAFLSREDYEFILACSQKRNAVAHGFRQRVEKEDVERLRIVASHLFEKKNNSGAPIQDQTVVEIVGGDSYEYTPLGQYVVKSVGVCGGRPTF